MEWQEPVWEYSNENEKILHSFGFLYPLHICVFSWPAEFEAKSGQSNCHCADEQQIFCCFWFSFEENVFQKTHQINDIQSILSVIEIKIRTYILRERTAYIKNTKHSVFFPIHYKVRLLFTRSSRFFLFACYLRMSSHTERPTSS